MPLGLYPIVDSSDWLKKLLPTGVSTIQLRIKDKALNENEIKTAITLAKQYHTRLFINDHWELAIQHGAYGVHLGQEDLHKVDTKNSGCGLRLGVSTHCFTKSRACFVLLILPLGRYLKPLENHAFAAQGLDKLNYGGVCCLIGHWLP